MKAKAPNPFAKLFAQVVGQFAIQTGKFQKPKDRRSGRSWLVPDPRSDGKQVIFCDRRPDKEEDAVGRDKYMRSYRKRYGS